MNELLKVLASFCLFGSLAGLGAVWLTVPAFVVYLVLHKFKRGCWRSPFDGVDALTFISFGYVLMVTWWLFPHEHHAKNMVSLANELMVLGGLFSVLLCARIPFVWKHPEWRMRFSILTFLIMAMASVLLGSLIPPAGSC